MMWKPFRSNDGNNFMVKWNKNDQEFTFFVTNLKQIWTSVCSIESIVVKYQQLNPLFDLKLEEAVTQVLNIFEDINQAEVKVTIDGSTLILKIEMNLTGSEASNIKTNFEIEFVKAETEKFTEMITIAMIQTINFLETQQKMLCNLLEKKDREIEEYQMEKGLISRSDLVTGKFDPHSLISSSQKLILNVFGNSKSFMDSIDNEYGEAQENVFQVEVESWNNVKKKRKYYDSKTALNSKCTKIVYKNNNS
ncbi:unnamed protein product [Phaedon cochleariae]|uniref:Non-homologous end-joining factor 1 n=1 Tax=Phaedon cochleariae TaxID=80249 RepID=A0A9P0DQJ6_PHACE|nr:unnamed protein product [Phaedon cochleariae]